MMAFAKEQPAQTIVWPATGNPIFRFTLGKFKEMGSNGSQRIYNIDIIAENVSDKKVSQAAFSIYLFDKNKARIGNGWISLTDAAPGQPIKFQTTVNTTGAPTSASIEAGGAGPKAVTLTVNSNPQGATLKVDGNDVGTTPKLVKMTVGKHMLEFNKEGYNTGHFPLEIGSDDASGGSVSYELGTSAHDTIELRDGSVLSGDLESVNATEVVVRIGGASQHFARNQVKRIAMVERDPAPAQ